MSRIDVAHDVGSLRTTSSKCDFNFHVEDALQRFSLSGRIAGSSKCDFGVLVDFGIRGGKLVRAAAGGSSKCDFLLSRLQEVSNPDPRLQKATGAAAVLKKAIKPTTRK